MKNVHHFDATAVEVHSLIGWTLTAEQILLEMIAEYKGRGIAVCFVKLKGQNQHIFWKAGLMELIGIEYMFSKTSDAVARLEGKVLDYSSYQIPSKV